MKTYHPRTAAGVALTSVALLSAAGCSTAGSDQSATAGSSSTPTGLPSTPASSAETPTSGPVDYRDGTFTQTGTYGGAPSHLGVTVTLKDDIITRVSVATPATDPTSLRYQKDFAEAVPGVVIGRNIDEAHVGKLAGSSGCPDGFNDAIDKIITAARS